MEVHGEGYVIRDAAYESKNTQASGTPSSSPQCTVDEFQIAACSLRHRNVDPILWNFMNALDIDMTTKWHSFKMSVTFGPLDIAQTVKSEELEYN